MKNKALLAALGIIATLSVSAYGGAGTVLSAFGEAIDHLHDYTVTVRTHEILGRRMQDRVLRYWYEKPSSAKAEIIEGNGRGSVAVWQGGSFVRGHLGGFFSIFRLTVNLHDAHATSLRGETIESIAFADIYRHFATVKGNLAEAPGPSIDGMPSDAIVLSPSAPADDGGLTREVLYLSRATHFPLRRQCFEGDRLVGDEQFVDLEINPGLTDGNFVL